MKYFQEFTPKQYLAIDIANNFGLDKLTWDERLKWFDQHEPVLESLVQKADEPALFHAGVLAYRKVQKGEPIGYPVSYDATASGMQILACLTGDRKAAELCNVVNRVKNGTVERADAYTIIYQAMLAVLGENSRIKREDTKQAIMTSLYGSSAVPREVFGEGILLRTFYKTMNQEAPAAWELNRFFLDIWNPEADAYHWVLPDNFHVHTKVMVNHTERVHFLGKPFDIVSRVQGTTVEGRSLSANVTHSLDGMIVRELTRRCSYDMNQVNKVWKCIEDTENGNVFHWDSSKDGSADLVITLWEHYTKTGYLSVRILDGIDMNTIQLVNIEVIKDLLNSLPKKPFHVLSVHDCFRVLPTYVNDLRKQYNHQLMMIAKSDLLSNILGQLMNKTVEIGKFDEELWKDIMDTNYALS